MKSFDKHPDGCLSCLSCSEGRACKISRLTITHVEADKTISYSYSEQIPSTEQLSDANNYYSAILRATVQILISFEV